VKAVAKWWTWTALAIFFLGANTFDALATISGLEFVQGPIYLLRFVSLFLTWQWLEAECRPHGQTYPLDMGMFLYAAGFLLLPYYLWRHQRWRGVLKLVLLLCLWGGSYVLTHGIADIVDGAVGE
jgi:hypothetical protein